MKRKLRDTVLLSLASFGHLGYPAFLWLSTRRREAPSRPRPTEWPNVSVVVPAFRESEVIAAKVRNLEDNGYPGSLEIVVVPEDRDTEAAACRTGAVVVPYVERTGKAGALNRGVTAATHPLVVLTDANAMATEGTLSSLVAWLTDPRFAAATARKEVAGEGIYWRFEHWLKLREMRTGSTIGLDGALVALRKADYRPLPEDVVVDDLWLALDMLETGTAIAYDADATVSEDGFPSIAADWERRTRIVAGTLDVLWRRRDHLLAPEMNAVQLWGHRAVRSGLGPVAHLLLLAAAVREARDRPAARLLLAGHAAGAIALLRSRRGAASAPERAVAQVLYLQAVGVGGVVRFLRGDRPARWEKADRPMAAARIRGAPDAGRARCEASS